MAQTFKGIIRALTQYAEKLIQFKVRIYVRRGGPNYQQGLRDMQECGDNLGIPIEVYGPETHLTSIVSYALKDDGPNNPKRPRKNFEISPIQGVAFESSLSTSAQSHNRKPSDSPMTSSGVHSRKDSQDSMELENPTEYELFNKNTFSIVYGMQPSAVQNMLDFDHLCRRKKPSVVAMIYPFSGNHFQKFYWGKKKKRRKKTNSIHSILFFFI